MVDDERTALPDSLPEPEVDGRADHLVGSSAPVSLPATDWAEVDLSAVSGTVVGYCFSKVGRTAPSVLLTPGSNHRSSSRVIAQRLTDQLRLPTFEVAGEPFDERLTLVLDDGRVDHVFYPVFPPDEHAAEVVRWLETRQ